MEGWQLVRSRSGARAAAPLGLALSLVALPSCSTAPDSQGLPNVEPAGARAGDGAEGSSTGGGATPSEGASGSSTGSVGGGTEQAPFVRPTCPLAESRSGVATTSSYGDTRGRADVRATPVSDCIAEYEFRTTQPLRGGTVPGGAVTNPRIVVEELGAPTLRTTNPLFDGAYALTLAEVREASVSAIRDYAFSNGQNVPCPPGGCFETGALWPYVWTRDTAYAVDLGLAAIDPARAVGSLSFKLSDRRTHRDLGGLPEIVQDTGTGGSWPVSTDRVVWALGARRVLEELEGAEYEAFAARAYASVANTLERDRRVVFDPRDGLYFGETSFLDWREQTYPAWTAQDPVAIATTKALSVNVLMLVALEQAVQLGTALAEKWPADRASAERPRIAEFARWATALRTRIHERFFLSERGAYAMTTGPALDGAAVPRFDALATALAVIEGVGTPSSRGAAIANYPWAELGPPVVFPQERVERIYHNRAIWPFVTAYMTLAARKVESAEHVARGVASVVSATALNLSNMENLELLSGLPWFDDGPWSGPVVNSARQIWSVAGFVGIVHRVLFGQETERGAVRFRPYVPVSVHGSLLNSASTIVLRDLPFRGKALTVRLRFPEVSKGDGTGAYTVQSAMLDGRDIGDRFVAASELGRHAFFDIVLGPPNAARATGSSAGATGQGAARGLPLLSNETPDGIYAPTAPTVETVQVDGEGLRVRWSAPGEATGRLRHHIYRDGVRVASVGGDVRHWVDGTPRSSRSPCYAVERERLGENGAPWGPGVISHRSKPSCFWGVEGERIAWFDSDALSLTGGQRSSEHGRKHVGNWGDPGHTLTLPRFVASQSGPHLIALAFGNGGPLSTGITASVKRVVVTDADTGDEVGSDYVVLPHLGTWSRWGESSFARVTLEAGRAYRITVGDDDASVNMSAFEHFATYTGGLGGASGPFFRANVAAIGVLAGAER